MEMTYGAAIAVAGRSAVAGTGSTAAVTLHLEVVVGWFIERWFKRVGMVKFDWEICSMIV
jgi:hypothetical protein